MFSGVDLLKNQGYAAETPSESVELADFDHYEVCTGKGQ